MVVRYPLACSNLAKDAAMIPLPKEEVTPPVTKMYLVCDILDFLLRGVKVRIAAQKSGGFFGKLFLKFSNHGLQAIVLNGQHDILIIAEFPIGKTFLFEPDQIRQRQIHQITALMLAKRHFVMGQFQQLLLVRLYFHLWVQCTIFLGTISQ